MEKDISNRELAIRTIEEYSNGLTRDFEVFQEIQKSASDRMIWYTAISGFALVNIHGLANIISPSSLSGIQVAIVTIPWALAGLSAIIAHWLLGDVRAKDNAYYLTKKHVAQTFLATLTKEPRLEDVLAIIDSDKTNQLVIKLGNEVRKISPWFRRVEKLTLFLLFVAFSWSLLYPLFLNL